MSWIQMIQENEADEGLADLYERARDPRTGQLDNIMSIHSLNPAGLDAHIQLYDAVMRSTDSLRKVERELIAVVVSQINACHY